MSAKSREPIGSGWAVFSDVRIRLRGWPVVVALSIPACDRSRAGSGGAESSTGGAALDPCADAIPSEGGYAICSDGTVRRPVAAPCAALAYPHEQPCEVLTGNPACEEDSECGDHGRCLKSDGLADCRCERGCQSDEDAGPGSACLCDGVYGSQRVIAAECRSDVDCPAGSVCMLSRWDQSTCDLYIAEAELRCLPADAACRSDSECVAAGEDFKCAYAVVDDGVGWQCAVDDCGIAVQPAPRADR